ncbi:hypothetical protein V8F06_006080 [Rhypophila decipiens]
MSKVVPILTGKDSIPNEGAVRFTNFKSLTGGLTVNAAPDFFDGALSGDVDKSVREDLSQMIIPTEHPNVPVAPNFFLGAKPPAGRVDVARRQACYNGAYGARAMHALQNYNVEESVYNGKAYTYSSTYYAGQLKLYAHHISAPTDPKGRPEYHMTQVKAYALTGRRETCVQGIGAFRNARDLAQRHRNMFIQQANRRARRSDAPSVDEPEAEAQQYGDTGFDQFVDCEDYVGSQVVAAENYSTSHDIDEGSAVPQHPAPPAKNRPHSGPVSEYRGNRTRPGRHFPS